MNGLDAMLQTRGHRSRRVRRRLSVTLATAALAVVTMATPANALSFGAPVVLADDGIYNWWQDSGPWPGSLAASGGSYVHVAYTALVLDDWNVMYRRSSDGGATWSPAVEVSRPVAAQSTGPSLSVVSATVDLVWAHGQPFESSSIWYRRSTNSGTTWTVPRPISPPAHGLVGRPTVARQGNTVLVSYTEMFTGAVYFRRSIDGGTTWEDVRWLGTTNRPYLGATKYDGWPSVAFGGGVLYAVWHSSGKNIVLKRSFNGGVNWTLATHLATAHVGGVPRIIASGSEAMLAFGHYLGPGQPVNTYVALRKTVDKGSHWAPLVRVSGGTRPALAADVRYTGGRYRIVYRQWLDDAGDTSALFYRESVSGATWTSPVRFTSPTNAEVTSMGIGYTSVTGRTWLGWAGFAPDLYGDILVRSVE